MSDSARQCLVKNYRRRLAVTLGAATTAGVFGDTVAMREAFAQGKSSRSHRRLSALASSGARSMSRLA
jgi:hypothetical protein